MKSIPEHFQLQSSEQAPRSISASFATDVARRHQQLMFILRETISSYTLTTIIKSEKHEDLYHALIVLCSQMHSLHNGGATVRVGAAPGFCALATDPILLSHGITLEIDTGSIILNSLILPLIFYSFQTAKVLFLPFAVNVKLNLSTLALATANSNFRNRRGGLSKREVWTQCDQVTGEQLPIVDRQLILSQNNSRQHNHTSSAKSKAGGRVSLPSASVSFGDLE